MIPPPSIVPDMLEYPAPVGHPQSASSPDPSFYELSPGGLDYLDRVSSLIARLVPGFGTVAEVGSASGELCRTLRDRSAVTGTQADPDGDLVLACVDDPARCDARKLLTHCLVSARRAVVWVVPADDGTRLLGPTLTGCLPRAWAEGLESRPLSLETLHAAVSRDCQPSIVASTAWSMPLVIRDLGAFTTDLTHRLGWSGSPREADLREHLAQVAAVHPFGHAIPVSRRSAVFAWLLQ